MSSDGRFTSYMFFMLLIWYYSVYHGSYGDEQASLQLGTTRVFTLMDGTLVDI
jgi:hypothetical protein